MTAIANDLPRDRALPEPRDIDLSGKSGGRAVKNTIATILMWSAFIIAIIPLVWILVTVAVKGGHLILDSTWWTNSQQGITPGARAAAPSTRSRAP
jgi:phosphate transport system permease protein